MISGAHVIFESTRDILPVEYELEFRELTELAA